ncbi:MAG: TRAP transporter large permease subunit [Oscillospiraceae bacterium]|nr:TRAP transporter large permease subunit [Oscillospiraceae bacterium]
MMLALGLFALMYVLLLVLSEHRWIVALATAAIFVAAQILPPLDALGAINWNVLMMLAGTMATVELFIQSRMPARLAEQLLQKVPNVQWAVVALSLFSGVVSAFVDNVATVLMVAPVGLAVARRLKTNPIPVIVAISVSSNLQGAATLVGDTTSILLAGHLNMSFNDFFWYLGRPGIAWAVEIGALLTIPVLLFLFRKEKEKVDGEVTTQVEDKVPSVLLVGTVLLLIAASQFKNKPELTNGYICCGMALIGVVYEWMRQRSAASVRDVLKAIDYKTLLLLAGLFMVIQGLTEAGVIEAIAALFVKAGGGSVLLMYVLIVGVSVLLSAFIDNIPYVATMLPVVGGIAQLLGVEPYLFAFGLLIGATLGGNITPVGASANIAGIGILQKEGYKVSTGDFVRIGVPFTLIAAVSGALVIWLVWAH